MFRDKFDRVSIMPFLWCIISVGASKYSLFTAIMCGVSIVIAIVLTYVSCRYICGKYKYGSNYIRYVASSLSYLIFIGICNVMYVILSIGFYRSAFVFFAMLFISCVLNIGYVKTAIKNIVQENE